MEPTAAASRSRRAPHFQMAHTLDCQKQLLTNTLSFVSVLGGRSLGIPSHAAVL